MWLGSRRFDLAFSRISPNVLFVARERRGARPVGRAPGPEVDHLQVLPDTGWLALREHRSSGKICGAPHQSSDQTFTGEAEVRVMFENSTVCHSRRISLMLVN